MKKLYLMRHGETLFNTLGKIQGACDSPLTNEGIQQAKTAKNFFTSNQIELKSFYSSTQERASDTLEIIIGNQDYKRMKGLKEWNFGLFEGESERINPKIPRDKTSFADSFVPYGGESAEIVQARMNDTLLEIMEEKENEHVLVVSHGGSMFMFAQKWLPFDQVSKMKFSNCCILEFNYESNNFIFQRFINHNF